VEVRDSTTVAAIRLQDLRKQFGHVVAVDGIDLTVPQGSVYGYLGPNGAGKTTSLRIMLGLVRPSSGSAELFGRDPQVHGVDALDGVAGFVESPMFYPYLSGRRNLHLLADLDGGDGHDRVEDVLEVVELEGRGNDKVGGYSQGMRQRLGLAAALLRRPRLLLLDEPTNGLDPGGMRDMRRLIGNLAADGLTVLLSSHLMGEVEQLCNELAIIARGRIRFAGTLTDLRERQGGFDYRLQVTDSALALSAGGDVAGVQLARGDAGGLLVRADPDAVACLTVSLGRAGVGIYSMLPDTPSLERMFFELTEGAEVVDGSADEAA
jgi:ABC-2 type transport system ATP-binding protein